MYAYLEDMRDRVLFIDLLLHDTILIHTDRRQNIKHTLVHGFQAVDDESHGDLLPAGDTLLCAAPPVLGLLGLADVTDVEHDAVQCASVEGFVFVVRSHGDKQFGFSVVHLRAQ